MSQLRRSATPSAGDSKGFSKLAWTDFVQLVLVLTAQAYLAMREDRIAKRNWEENVFTLRLGYDYIRTIALDNELPIRVWVRTKKHTRLMSTGEQTTIEAKEIDLLLFDVWEREYHQRHFVWEAKRVGDKRVEPDCSNLNSEYVNEAIYRFIRGEYAQGLSDAGVLGYVLAGEVANIVGDINKSMGRLRNNPVLHNSDHLQITSPVNQFRDVYQSRHIRTDKTSIQLYHLFFAFDFA